MPENGKAQFYEKPASYLSQGDIFRIDMVGPGADFAGRIFRSTDGRHGSCVFEEGCEARVFSQSELEDILNKVRKGPLHTDPFYPTQDGTDEMVVVFAKLFKYFIIGTQTCDICGIDKPPSQHAVILPVIPFVNICKSVRLPFDDVAEIITIHDYVTRNCSEAAALNDTDDIGYLEKLKEIIQKWNIDKKMTKESVGKIKNYIGNYYKKGFLHFLAKDLNFNIPESGVDFTMIFTVPVTKLIDVQSKRIATLKDSYRHQFSQAFTDFFGRIAVPHPMTPPKI